VSLTAVIIAVVIVALALFAWMGWFVLKRRTERRRPPRHEHVRLEEEDWNTVAPSETPGDVHIVRDE
jgi:HAMP domain-containing protein